MQDGNWREGWYYRFNPKIRNSGSLETEFFFSKYQYLLFLEKFYACLQTHSLPKYWKLSLEISGKSLNLGDKTFKNKISSILNTQQRNPPISPVHWFSIGSFMNLLFSYSEFLNGGGGESYLIVLCEKPVFINIC